MSGDRPVVLLVDDEVRILSALRRCLRREGWEILTAETLALARETLRTRRVDLVVSDQKMPGGSGLAFLEEVARSYPGVRRILLTGWPEEVPPPRLATLGIAALLPKPWDDAELKAVIRAQLGGGR